MRGYAWVCLVTTSASLETDIVPRNNVINHKAVDFSYQFHSLPRLTLAVYEKSNALDLGLSRNNNLAKIYQLIL